MSETSLVQAPPRMLTAEQFEGLAKVPPEAEWFFNIENPRTRAAYKRDVKDFVAFVGIQNEDELRIVKRAHVIAWRDAMKKKSLASSSIRRKLSAVASLFDFLCDRNAVPHNPVDGVARPKEHSNEGLTPAISAKQARALLDIPSPITLQGVRDRAILATFLHQALRVSPVCSLRVKDFTERRGYKVFRFKSKGDKIQFVEVHPETAERIEAYLTAAGHGEDKNGPLFRPVRNNLTKIMEKHLDRKSVWSLVKRYARKVGIKVEGFTVHSLRATAITQALEGGSELSRVQAWAGHASPTTTKMYDKRDAKPEQSPTFNTNY
jgi:site-specific recombinase XerD